jgi:hypothetical protein
MTALEEHKVQLLNRMIKLYHRNSQTLRTLARLAGRPDAYSTALQALERQLDQAGPDPAVPPSAWPLTREEWHILYGSIAGSEPLRALFGSASSPLSGAPPEQVAVFAQLADIGPDPKTMFNTQDTVFMRVLDGITRNSLTDADQLMTEDLAKFIGLYEEHRDLAARLSATAASPHLWHTVLPALEAEAANAPEPAALSDDAAKAVQEWRVSLTPDLPAEFQGAPRASTMSRRLVRLAWDNRREFGQVARQSNPEPPAPSVEEERRKSLAVATLEHFRQQDRLRGIVDGVAADLNLRIEVARHLLGIRTFVKWDAFVYRWPEVAHLAMAHYSSLVAVENYFVEGVGGPPSFPEEEAARLFDRYSKDEQFVRFLRLRPYFSEMDEDELIQYRPAAPILIEGPDTLGSTPPPLPSSRPIVEAVSRTTSVEYLNLIIRFNQILPRAREAATTVMSTTRSMSPPILDIWRARDAATTVTSPAPDSSTYRIAIVTPKMERGEIERQLAPQALLKEVRDLLGISSSRSDLADFFEAGRDVKDRLLLAGMELSRAVFGGPVLDLLVGALQEGQRVRIVLATDTLEVMDLPWEWLTLPGRPEFLFQSSPYSLVRSFPAPTLAPMSPLVLPLRVLGIFMDPLVGQSHDVRRGVDNLGRTLRGPNPVELHVLVGEEATVETVTSQIIGLRPHIVHLEVPGLVPDYPQGELGLVLSLGQRGVGHVDKSDLSTLLSTAHVPLVIFGSNINVDRPVNTLARLAGELVRAGLPAAVVPMRRVRAADAQAFTRELYRSLLYGRPLETAITESRRTLSSRNMDWSAFALFANITALDALRIPTSTTAA